MAVLNLPDKKWIFKLGDSTHQVELKQQFLKNTQVTVDGESLDWKQSIFDLLDFGGRYSFTLRSSDPSSGGLCLHECQVVVNMWRTYLLVDGVDVETRRRYPFSVFRLSLRLVMLSIVLLAMWGSMPLVN